MRSRMRFLKHPLHPMIVMFPVAIFPLLLFLDAIQWWTGAEALWDAATWITLAGLVMTVAAIVPGVADMRPLRDGTRAHRVAVVHAVVGTLILVAFAGALWLRWQVGPDRLLLAGLADASGVLLVSVQGWLGGELVYHHHVGVTGVHEGGEPAEHDAALPHGRSHPRERGRAD